MIRKSLVVLATLSVIIFLAGCNENKENDSLKSPQETDIKNNKTEELNKTIDDFAQKAKILNENIQNIGKDINNKFNRFVEQNKDNLEIIKENAIDIAKDVDENMKKIKDNLQDMAFEANKSINSVIKDLNNTFDQKNKDQNSSKTVTVIRI